MRVVAYEAVPGSRRPATVLGRDASALTLLVR